MAQNRPGVVNSLKSFLRKKQVKRHSGTLCCLFMFASEKGMTFCVYRFETVFFNFELDSLNEMTYSGVMLEISEHSIRVGVSGDAEPRVEYPMVCKLFVLDSGGEISSYLYCSGHWCFKFFSYFSSIQVVEVFSSES